MSVRGDFQEVRRYLDRVKRKEVVTATAGALNDTAFDMRGNLQKGIRRDLDRPTPFTVRGIQVKRARRSNLTAAVFIEQKRWEYLEFAVDGGVQRPQRKVIMIGLGRRNRYGNVPGFRRLRARLLARKDHFEGQIGGASGIWKKFKTKPPKLVVAYVEEARYERRFRFYERAEKTAVARWPEHFYRHLERRLRHAGG